MKAKWNNIIIAESDTTEQVENNHYFPVDSIKREYFEESSTHTICSWKGEASYFNLVVNGQNNNDAAWYYPSPKDAAKHIKGMVAFWKGVEIIE